MDDVISGDGPIDASYNAIPVVIVCLVLPLYIFGLVLPSIGLNGVIIITFLRTKVLQTPSNLLSVHISIIGLCITLFYSSLSIPAFAMSLIHCSCELSYYKWIIAHVFHFALFPLNIAAISACYFFIIKFSSEVVTFARVLCVIVGMWVVAIVGNVPTFFVVPHDTFVNCCEEICKNDSYHCPLLVDTFTPNLFSVSSEVFFILQDIMFIYIPIVLVLGFTTGSYFIFRFAMVHPKTSLKRRMVLLPILMTISDLIITVGQNIINWVPFTTHQHGIPGNFVPFLFGLIWDFSGLIYPILILYFNIHLRKACYELFFKQNRLCGIIKVGREDKEEDCNQNSNSSSSQTSFKPSSEQQKEWQDYLENMFKTI